MKATKNETVRIGQPYKYVQKLKKVYLSKLFCCIMYVVEFFKVILK
ncbi:hypothetical protein HNR63_000637 [Anoxybacillus kamchatkensis]|nr:hypothetical protein [Anoxybacillus ayderensis]